MIGFRNIRKTAGILWDRLRFLSLCCKKGRNDKTSLTTNRITKKNTAFLPGKRSFYFIGLIPKEKTITEVAVSCWYRPFFFYRPERGNRNRRNDRENFPSDL